MRANADIQIGLVLEQLGKEEDPQKHLDGIVAENPKNLDALSALANIERARKEFVAPPRRPTAAYSS